MQYHYLKNGYLNQEKARYEGVGEYGIPRLPAVDVPLDGCKFVRFDMAPKYPHPEQAIVHFFTADYKFECFWRDPDRYIRMLSRFRAVVAPDFSLYSDYPKSAQVFNHFRKHWLGAYMTGAGITVIPSPSWVVDDEGAFSWCLDGEPEGSTICISTHGAVQGYERKAKFLHGYAKVLDRLTPSRVYLYGDMFPGLWFCGDFIHIDNEIMAQKRRYQKRGEGA